jgi:hypothetical protein
LSPSLASGTISIYVGPAQDKFEIHETLLRAQSGFFDTALKKEWTEGQDRKVDLPETAVADFKIWMKWLYTGRVYVAVTDETLLLDNTKAAEDEFYNERSLYALGDFLQDPDFKDAIIDAIIDSMVAYMKHPLMLADHIYLHSAVGSSHRLLPQDIFINCWAREDWGHGGANTKDFLTDVLKVLAPNVLHGVKATNTATFFANRDTCKYHEHGPDKPCYKKKPAFRF